MIFLDTETVGFHGVPILIQYAEDNGEIVLHNIWHTPITDTLKLIEKMTEHTVVGFNLAFDWFHINKIYNILSLYRDHDAEPVDIVQELALLEKKARDGFCIKPKSACDLMIHARKGPYQSTMDRNDIRIRRVPTSLAWKLRDELNRRIVLPDLYFARKQDPSKRFDVYDIKNDLDDIDPNFKDIVLKFAPSSALKALAKDALHIEDDVLKLFTQVECSVKTNELGYAPFAEALGTPKDWKRTWPDTIYSHIDHWTFNDVAREYAKDDIVYTRGLYKYFSGLEQGISDEESRDFANSDRWFDDKIKPLDTGDNDSILACMVGAVRWKGFKINVDKLKVLKAECEERIKKDMKLATTPSYAKKILLGVMDETEKLIIASSTKKEILESIAQWDSPAAEVANRILDARRAKKKLETLDKLILAGRFHASFKVTGTLSNRMSGTDGLNAQGIGHDKELRSCFDLAWESMQLSGGDFKSFEVSIADAEYADEKLHADLCTGKKIHGLLGQIFYDEYDYDSLLENDEKYNKSKQGVFAFIYGGQAFTLSNRLNLSLEKAEDAYQEILTRYPGIGKSRNKVMSMFESLAQPGGIGTKIEYKSPSDYIESMLGFRRYFTMENRIIKILFELAQNPPDTWKDLKIKVTRRDRQQSVSGATQSALYGAAFNIQSAIQRAAGNHRIQSTGAEITKDLEKDLWDLQPIGIKPWKVILMNIHDEIMAVNTSPKEVKDVVDKSINKFKELIPLIGIDWYEKLDSWADK